MKLLAALCAAKLPFQIVEADDIEKLAVLKSTGFVDAEIPPMLVEGDGWRYAAPALVEKVTESGYAACRTREQSAVPLAEGHETGDRGQVHRARQVASFRSHCSTG